MFDGNWKKGERHGKGVYYFRDGRKWHGTWKNGMNYGEGTLEDATGKKTKGTWEELIEEKQVSYYQRWNQIDSIL